MDCRVHQSFLKAYCKVVLHVKPDCNSSRRYRWAASARISSLGGWILWCWSSFLLQSCVFPPWTVRSSSCVASLIMVAEYKREIPAAMQRVKLVFIQRTGASLQHQLNMSLAINASAEVHLFMSELIPYQSHRFFLTRSWKDHEHHLILQRTGGYIGLQTNCFIRLNLNRKWTKETLLSTRGRKTVWKYLIRQWRLVDVL